MRCVDCKFCKKTDEAGRELTLFGEHYGYSRDEFECRLSPPVMDDRGRAKWPKVDCDDFCGSFEAKADDQ